MGSPASLVLDAESTSDGTGVSPSFPHTEWTFLWKTMNVQDFIFHEYWEFASFWPVPAYLKDVSNLDDPFGPVMLHNIFADSTPLDTCGDWQLGSWCFSDSVPYLLYSKEITDSLPFPPPSLLPHPTHIYINEFSDLTGWEDKVKWNIILDYCPLILIYFCMQL